ncbi:hypothetical protein ACSJIW_27415, partial [Escherichia coli]|uniref:hypothetical protein n=1 Tax=Escherichia coli TaxID=562 RepID=UPI003EE0CA9E
NFKNISRFTKEIILLFLKALDVRFKLMLRRLPALASTITLRMNQTLSLLPSQTRTIRFNVIAFEN